MLFTVPMLNYWIRNWIILLNKVDLITLYNMHSELVFNGYLWNNGTVTV